MIRDYLRRVYRLLVPYVYARTNYKLFLQKTFIELDQTVKSIICSTDVLSGIVKPVPVIAPFGDSMLVIAPHQDDEIIGCGGAMILQRNSGRKVKVVFVYDGGDEHKYYGFSRNKMVGIREGEALRVSREMNIENPVFLRHKDSGDEEIRMISKEISKEIIKSDASRIFTPFFLDQNIAHRKVNFALAEALASAPENKMVYGYEVWGLSVSNIVLSIDSVMEEKQRLLSIYKSQLSGTDYLNSVTGLNMYHSRTFGGGLCKYAEKFFEIPAGDYINIIRKLRYL